MAARGTERIVIRRKAPVSNENHSGVWKIAYADFVTAMMAFFLVMWLIAIVPKQDLHAIAQYFRMPLMTAITGGPKVDSSTTPIPAGSPSVIPNKNPLPQRSDVNDMSDGDRRDRQRLENLKSDLDQLIKTDPVLRQFRPQLLLDMTPDGLRIQIIDEQNRPMFDTGSATMQPYMSAILRELAPVFNKLPNKLSISGHTDAVQYSTGERQYSNWELSADRANAARRELIAGGLDADKVKRVIGLSSTVSLVKDNPLAAVNRRISLVVLNRRAERRIDAQNATSPALINARSVSPPDVLSQLAPGAALPGALSVPGVPGASNPPPAATPSPGIVNQ
jgi:chemotaxis protein MotB